jgi:hypothetical protein
VESRQEDRNGKECRPTTNEIGKAVAAAIRHTAVDGFPGGLVGFMLGLLGGGGSIPATPAAPLRGRGQAAALCDRHGCACGFGERFCEFCKPCDQGVMSGGAARPSSPRRRCRRP